ncbi:MAG: delta-60 repeat domain-containing protein [Bdellovibrionales bacterium]|nr:delta-60 repeat domain-containing protein [Bdellovibrionales bacterium]
MKQVNAYCWLCVLVFLTSCTGEMNTKIGSSINSEEIVNAPEIVGSGPTNEIKNPIENKVSFNGEVKTVTSVSDGGTLIYGDFTHYGDTQVQNLVKLNQDLTIDSEFQKNIAAGVNGPVNKIIEKENGHLVLGGHFSFIGGITVNSYVVLNPNGSVNLDETNKIGKGFYGLVNDIAISPDHEVVVVGNFNEVDDKSIPPLALLTLEGDLLTTEYVEESLRRLSGEERITCENIKEKIVIQESLKKQIIGSLESNREYGDFSALSLSKKKLRAYEYFKKKESCESISRNDQLVETAPIAEINEIDQAQDEIGAQGGQKVETVETNDDGLEYNENDALVGDENIGSNEINREYLLSKKRHRKKKDEKHYKESHERKRVIGDRNGVEKEDKKHSKKDDSDVDGYSKRHLASERKEVVDSAHRDSTEPLKSDIDKKNKSKKYELNDSGEGLGNGHASDKGNEHASDRALERSGKKK